MARASVLRYMENGGPALCNADDWNPDIGQWEECDRNEYSRGLCNKHYQKLRNIRTYIMNTGSRDNPIYERDGVLPGGMRLGWEEPYLPYVEGPSAHWCQFVKSNGATCPNHSDALNGRCKEHQLEVLLAEWNAPPMYSKPVRTCTVCGDKHYAKGYCRRHYYQQHSVQSSHSDLERYILGVHPADGNYSELDGCGADEPARRAV